MLTLMAADAQEDVEHNFFFHFFLQDFSPFSAGCRRALVRLFPGLPWSGLVCCVWWRWNMFWVWRSDFSRRFAAYQSTSATIRNVSSLVRSFF